MDIKKLTRIFQPHLIALLGLFALNVLFFSPLVNGKKLKQEDINQFEYITRFNEKTDNQSIVGKYSDNFNGSQPLIELYNLARELFGNIIGNSNWIDIEFKQYPKK